MLFLTHNIFVTESFGSRGELTAFEFPNVTTSKGNGEEAGDGQPEK